MDNVLVHCTAVNLLIENCFKTVFLCKFCSSITLLPDIAHNCNNIDAPQALKNTAGHTYYEITKIELLEDSLEVIYEPVN